MLTEEKVESYLDNNKEALSNESTKEYLAFTQLVRFKYSHNDEYLFLLENLINGTFGDLSAFSDLFAGDYSDSKLLELYNSSKNNDYEKLYNAEISFLEDGKNSYKEYNSNVYGLKYTLSTAINKCLHSKNVVSDNIYSGDNRIYPVILLNLNYTTQISEILNAYSNYIQACEIIPSNLNFSSSFFSNMQSAIRSALINFPFFLKVSDQVIFNDTIKPGIVELIKFIFLNFRKNNKYALNKSGLMSRVNILIDAEINNQKDIANSNEQDKRFNYSLYPFYNENITVRDFDSETYNGASTKLYDLLISHCFFDTLLFTQARVDSISENYYSDIINDAVMILNLMIKIQEATENFKKRWDEDNGD